MAKFTYTPESLVEGAALTDSAATLYTVPLTAQSALIGEIYLMNTHTADVTVTIRIIPLGDTAAIANTIFSAVTVTPNIPQWYDLKKVMKPGSVLSALASVTAVCHISVSGAVVTE